MATALSPNFQVAPPGSPAARPRSEAAIIPMPTQPTTSSSPLPIRTRRLNVAAGDRGTAQTIRHMERLAMGAEGARSPAVRQAALQILRGAPNRDYADQVERLYQWVKNNIEFRGEHAETLQSPQVTLQLGAGDCDCQAALLAALLGSVGFRTRFVTVAGDPTEPDEFSHVYLEVRDKRTGQWTPLDTTDSGATPGWEPKTVTRRRAWEGMGDPDSGAATVQQLVNNAYSAGRSSGLSQGTETNSLLSQFGTPLIDALAQRAAYGKAVFAPGLSPTPLGGDVSPITQGGGFGPIVIFGSLALLAFAAIHRR